MAWDDTKSTADDPNNPSGVEQLTATEWNNMVSDQKSRITGVSVEDDGTVVLETEGINFGSNLSVSDDGDNTVTVNLSDPVSLTDITIENSFTDPAGVKHTGELADIDDIGGGGGGDIATVTVASSSSSYSADYNCDGTNDHVTINNAIASLPSDGGSVVLTEGTFNLAGQIDNQAVNNVSLVGQGYATNLFLTAGSDTFNVNLNGSLDWTVRNLRIDGNAANQNDVGKNSQGGIQIDSATRATITECWILNTYYANINGESDVVECRVTNNYLYNTVGGADNAEDNVRISGPNSARNIVSDNYCDKCAHQAIEISGNSDYTVVADNIIYDSAKAAINVHDNEGAIVSGNYIDTVGTSSLFAITTSASSVIGNIVDNATGSHGLGIQPSNDTTDGTTAVGNRIIDAGDDGIRVERDNATVVGNSVLNSGGNGINVLGSNATVGFNTITGSTNLSVAGGATGDIIAFNQTDDGSGQGYYVQSTEPANPKTNDIWFDI